jgi:hypothetical protein
VERGAAFVSVTGVPVVSPEGGRERRYSSSLVPPAPIATPIRRTPMYRRTTPPSNVKMSDVMIDENQL